MSVKDFIKRFIRKQTTVKKPQNKLLQHITPNLTQTQNTKLTQKIQISEIREAIYSMENGKFPGIDGLPIEFYKDFYELLKNDLQNLHSNTLFHPKNTPKIWNQALITLIPKKNDIEQLKYW